MTTRSSPPGAGSTTARGAIGGAPTASGEPHAPQNFALGAFGVPHAAHDRIKAVPHSPQNFRRGSFSVPQAGHAEAAPAYPGAGNPFNLFDRSAGE